MGVVRSQLEPLMEHLVKGCSQLWEHRWKQFLLTSYNGWQLGKISTSKSSPLECLVLDPWNGVGDSFFISGL